MTAHEIHDEVKIKFYGLGTSEYPSVEATKICGQEIECTAIPDRDPWCGIIVSQVTKALQGIKKQSSIGKNIQVSKISFDQEGKMSQPTVFISYSHEDEQDKNALLKHLGVLQNAGLITTWSDDQIGAGADWEPEIEQAMARARVAILLITANFLTSKFILNTEVPTLLKRRQQEGAIVFPIIARACAWKNVDWLQRMQVRPKNGRPVWADGGSHVDEDLAAIAEEVATIVSTSRVKTPDNVQAKLNEKDKYQTGIDKAALRNEIIARYSLEQVRTLCEDFGIDYENLPYTTKDSLVRELIRELERRKELNVLARKISR